MTDIATTSPADLFSTAGKTFLITGAAGAFGSASARALAANGSNLVLAGSSEGALKDLTTELGPDKVKYVVRRPDSVEDVNAMVQAAVDAFGRLDGALVASGTNKPSLIGDMAVEEFDAVMNANIRGAWLVCKAAGTQMKAQGGGGSVILVSSTRGKLGHAGGYSAYSASKGATDSLARNQAVEWGKDQIRVNAIGPTVFRSAVTAWMYEGTEKGTMVREGMLAHIPLGRLAEPNDFVGTVIFLLSDASKFLTGQIIYVDGGYVAC